jgi:hypothetical protein
MDTDCNTDCEAIGEEPIGVQIVVAQQDGGDDCPQVLAQAEGNDSIPISESSISTVYRDGSASDEIELPLPDANLLNRPLIAVGEKKTIKAYQAGQVLGNFRIVAKNGMFYLQTDNLPSLLADSIDSELATDHVLGANRIESICGNDIRSKFEFIKIATNFDYPEILAVDDSVETEYETLLAFDPKTNDTGVNLLITSVVQPANGTVLIIGGGDSLYYIPDASYDGPDSFTYTVTDDYGQTDTATVSVTVNPQAAAFTGDCADGCSGLTLLRPASAVPSLECWIDTICRAEASGTKILSYEDGSTRSNDLVSTDSATQPRINGSGDNIGILFNDSANEHLKKLSMPFFNSGSGTGGVMIVVISVDALFAGTRIPVACWGPPGSPLLSIEFDYSGSWTLTGKANGQTRTIALNPLGKKLIIGVGNQVDFGGGAASYIRAYEASGGAAVAAGLTHATPSTAFPAGTSGDLYVGGFDTADTGSFKLHELLMFSRGMALAGVAAGEIDVACLALKWS